MTCIPDNSTLQDLIHAINNAAPRPHHSTLLAAVADVAPECTFRFVLSKGGWHRTGGVLDKDGNHLGHDLETWVDTELATCDDDFGRFVEHYTGAGLLVTRRIGCTHYFVAPYGPAPEDFLQLEVEELQEVMDRKLFDPERLVCDRTELVEPTSYTKLEAHPVGSPLYRFVRLTDIREVVDRQNAQGGRGSSLVRFMADWAHSRATDCGQFCEHWLVTGLERYLSEQSSSCDLSLISVHSRTLKPFQWDDGKAGVELANLVRDFDRAAGYPGAWYFHIVASKLVPDKLALALKHDIDSGFQYLPDKEQGLLEKLVAEPYRVGLN